MREKAKNLLTWFAKRILAKYKPIIIGVTGSIGKTSTRHAIAAALSAKYSVREPERNYNSEVGLPLTVIGAHAPEHRAGIRQWLPAFLKAVGVLWLPGSYPQVLVLEYGIDHPGDMDYLLKFAQPSIAVLTTIGISHKEFFNTEQDIAYEKGKLAAGLPDNGTFVYNADDQYVAEQAKRTKAGLLSYAVEGQADVTILKVEEKLSLPVSMAIVIKAPTREIVVKVPVVGSAHLSAIVAAVAVAEKLEVETDLIIKGLNGYKPVPGRLNIISGIKHTTIIDDTYNAAPLSTIEALKLLARIPVQSKIAVLGSMLELGDLTESAHKEVGDKVAGMNLDNLVTVGEFGKIISDQAIAKGMPPERVQWFKTSEEARKAVQDMLPPDSVILIKGSQGARMEKITKEIMAEPMRAQELLTRQYGKWLD